MNKINEFVFTVEGAETIARSISRHISRHAICEQIYLQYDAQAVRAVKGLQGVLVKLYAANLIYLT